MSIHAGMAFLHEEKDDHNYTDERKEYGAKDRCLSEPQKAHLTGEFVIVAKFGDHALCHLAFQLANVIRQGGREGGREADYNLSLAFFKKIHTQASIIVTLFYALYMGLVTSKQFNKGTFLSHNMLIGCFFCVAILGALHFWGDPCLNSTTVLFDRKCAIAVTLIVHSTEIF